MASDTILLPRAIAVSALMPCLNEAQTLPLCIAKIDQAFAELGLVGEIVVADNGSTDSSREIAASLGARVILERRQGYGSALLAGIRQCKGQIIVMADADDSYDWSRLGDFVHKIDEGYDLVMGNRFLGGIEPGAMPRLHRYLGNPVLSALTRWLYKIPIGDFHCGMRAFTRTAVDRMFLRTSGMEFATEMVISAAQADLRIAETPTRLYPDKRNRPPHLRSFRDGWRHLRFILTYAPDYLYLVPGFLLALLGLLGMTLLSGGPATIGSLSLGIHFLALSSLLTMLGANVLGFGVMAKVYNSTRYPIQPDSLIAGLLRHFTLERGILVGTSLAIGGICVDAAILFEWLARNRSEMGATVHLAFVASTLTVLGVNLVFGSFLLRMMQEDVSR